MSPKQPSKQKRAAQNRQQRAALEARRSNARAEASSAGAGTGTGASSGGGGGGLLSRLRGGGGAGASAGARGGGRARPTLSEARAMQPPGYRAALSAVFAALAAIFLCTFMLRYPVNADGDLYSSERLAAEWTDTALRAAADAPDATPAELVDSIGEWAPGRKSQTVIMALWPFSLAIVLPLVGAGIAFWAVRRRAPSKVVNRALYATLFGAVLTQGLLLLFTPVVLAVGVAMFQVRKAEAMAAASAAPPPPDDDVIDVESAEVDLGAEVIDVESEEADRGGAPADEADVIEGDEPEVAPEGSDEGPGEGDGR